jgi:general secretion pathway protein H
MKTSHRDPEFSARCVASRPGGFTLLEIMLSLAVIALVAGVLVSGAVGLMGDKPATAEDVFWNTVLEARKLALKDERDARVSFDAHDLKFVVDDGTHTKEFAVPPSRDLAVDFLAPAQSGRSTVLIGGELVESQKIPFVIFFSDGTCSPFRVQFRNAAGPRVVNIDPWTCAKVLPAQEGNP